MRQQSLGELLGSREPDACVVPEGLEVYDLFCGAGGFSCGSELAGCRVVFACDSCEMAIETHKQNHPDATHQCLTLPADLPLPIDGRPFHLHGSPPCQQFSNGNSKGRTAEGHKVASTMVEWYLNLALKSRASSWSMEQVSTRGVVKIVERIRKRHPKKLAYHVFDLEQLGVPQTRRRLLQRALAPLRGALAAEEEVVRVAAIARELAPHELMRSHLQINLVGVVLIDEADARGAVTEDVATARLELAE